MLLQLHTNPFFNEGKIFLVYLKIKNVIQPLLLHKHWCSSFYRFHVGFLVCIPVLSLSSFVCIPILITCLVTLFANKEIKFK